MEARHPPDAWLCYVTIGEWESERKTRNIDLECFTQP